jgi:hypothetical protein
MPVEIQREIQNTFTEIVMCALDLNVFINYLLFDIFIVV